VATAAGQHRRDRGTGHLEEASEVDPGDGVEVGVGVVGERFGDEDPGIVHQGVHPAEAVQR
jgi:hypothetical protein